MQSYIEMSEETDRETLKTSSPYSVVKKMAAIIMYAWVFNKILSSVFSSASRDFLGQLVDFGV